MSTHEKELLQKALELIGSMLYSLPKGQLVWDMWEADGNKWVEDALPLLQGRDYKGE